MELVRELVTFSVETESRPRPALVSNRGTATVRYNPEQKPRYDTMKAVIAGAAWAALPADWEPVRGPVELRMVIEIPAPKGDPFRVWKVSKPDTENRIKGPADALTGIVWVDDSQVVALRVYEVYGDTDRITMQALLLDTEDKGYAWQASGIGS